MIAVAYKAGTAFIQITPSFRGFQLAVNTEAKKIRAVTLNIDADTTRAAAKVDRVAGDRSATVTATADTKGAALNLDRLAQDRKARLVVDADTSKAAFKVAALSAELDKVGGRGGGRLGAGLAGLVGGFNEVGSAIGGILTKAGAVGPAILAIGSAMSAAAAGGVALGGVLVAAGGAAAALGGVIKANVTEYQALVKQIKLDQTNMTRYDTAVAAARVSLAGATKGTASYQAASSRLKIALDQQRNGQQALNADSKKMHDQFGQLDKGINAFKISLGRLTQSTRPEVIGLMGHALQVVAGILPRLAPLVRGAAVAVDGLVYTFGQFTKTAQFQGILNFFARTGPAAIMVLGRSVGDVFVALLNVFAIGSSPTGKGFLNAIDTAAYRFRRFTESAKGVKVIGAWFKTGRDNLAAMGRLVQSVTGGLTSMGSSKSLAPLINQITNKVLPPLMRILRTASVSGALNDLVGAIGKVLTVLSKLYTEDNGLKAFAKTLGALATAAGWIVDHVPGASKALSTFLVVVGANQALRLVGLGGAVRSLGGAMLSLATATGRATAMEKLNIVWTRVQEASTKALTVVMWPLNAAIAAGSRAALGTRIQLGLLRVQEVLSTAASKALRVAQIGLAIATRGVGLAIRFALGPVGLIIIGLSALAAGLIYAYKHSATFHHIVVQAWQAVKDAAVSTLHWFTQSFIPFFTRTIPNAFHATVNWVKHNWPVILAILTGPIGLATLFIARHWTTITNAFKAARDWVAGAFKRTWSGVQAIILKPIQAARDAIGNIFGAGGPVRNAFSKAVTGITAIWSHLRDAVRKPIAFIVNTVYNKGIVPFVNRIPFIPGTLHTIPGWDTGGYTGRGGKYEPAGIVHRNEHVIRSESTESLNRKAPGFLDHLNKRGADALKGLLPGYSQGGGVGGGGLYRPTAHGSYGSLQREGGFNAVDIGVPQGTPVHAAASGRVTISRDLRGPEPRNTKQNGFYSYGRYIVVHSSRGNTIYAHLVRRLAGRGTQVRGGEVIGYSGHTGHTLGRTGDHLHFGANGSPSVYTYLASSTNYSGRGTAPGTTGGGGGGGAGYGGPSVKDARAALNPGKWLDALKGMGPWGGAFGGMVGGVVGKLKNVVVGKIKAAVSAANNFMFGSAMRFDASSRGVWKALRAAGWNQAAAAGMMGNIQYESGFSPTIVEGGGHSNNPASFGDRRIGYGLAQWTPPSKIARMLGGRPPTVGNEIAALTRELRGTSLARQLQAATSPVSAAMAYLHGFEKPRNPNQPWRGTAATAWFNRFARKPALHDSGGYIPPGLSQVYNGTRKPEAVFNAKQWADIHTLATRGADASRGGPMVNYENVHVTDINELIRKQRADTAKAVVMAGLA